MTGNPSMISRAKGMLAWLRLAGARVNLVGDHVDIDAPRGLLTADDRSLLARHKAELLALLTAEYHPPLPWRASLAGWPITDRELWGRRANTLEDQGLEWRVAEEQAFAEVTALRSTLQ